MSLSENTTALRSILATVNALPNAGGGGGSTVKTATGSFTTNGESYVNMEIACGFCPDVVFIHMPDAYSEDGYEYVNDMSANLSALSVDDWIVCCTYVGELYEEYFIAFGYIAKTENGFIASSFGEQDFNGDSWYTSKTYGYTAIKYT